MRFMPNGIHEVTLTSHEVLAIRGLLGVWSIENGDPHSVDMRIRDVPDWTEEERAACIEKLRHLGFLRTVKTD